MKIRLFALIAAAGLTLALLSGCGVFPLNQSGLFGNDTEAPSKPTDTDIVIHSSPADTDEKQNDASSDASDKKEDEKQDIFKTPVSQLNQTSQKALADYLFETYIPCSYGIFANAKDLSSPAVWSSVEALNQMVDKDTSAESHKLEAVLKKVKIYYPDTPFDPASVRLYDGDSKTFYTSPFQPEKYVFLSFEVKGETITIHYKDDPESEDPAQYATTLKKSGTEGYFSFVSSVRDGAVG